MLAVQNMNWECVFGTNVPLSLGCLCIVATDTSEEDPRVETYSLLLGSALIIIKLHSNEPIYCNAPSLVVWERT